jgi:hypothetical protein
MMSYSEFIEKTGKQDSKTTWIRWKVDACGMSIKEAVKAANDAEWGYCPLKSN